MALVALVMHLSCSNICIQIPGTHMKTMFSSVELKLVKGRTCARRFLWHLGKACLWGCFQHVDATRGATHE